MGNGSTFPYHLTSVRWRGGTQERAIRRRVVVPVQGGRGFRVGKSARIVESRCRMGRKAPQRDSGSAEHTAELQAHSHVAYRLLVDNKMHFNISQSACS